jgi:hypothetical protein
VLRQLRSSAGHTCELKIRSMNQETIYTTMHTVHRPSTVCVCVCVSLLVQHTTHRTGAAAALVHGFQAHVQHTSSRQTTQQRTVCFIYLISPCFQRLGLEQGVRSSCSAAQLCRQWLCESTSTLAPCPQQRCDSVSCDQRSICA